MAAHLLDAVFLSPVFATASHKHARPLTPLRAAFIAARAPVPVYALGGVNAAMNLKQLLPGIVGPIMGQPEIYLGGVGDAFDEHGELIKESLQNVLKQYIDAYAAFVGRHHR